MYTQATGTFEFKSWDEKPYSEVDGGIKLTNARVTNNFQGDVEGQGTLEYLMVYLEDGSGTFMGLEHLVGRIGDRSGSFVLQHSGTYDSASVNATWTVVPGSGTEGLRGLRGEGGFVAKHGQARTPFTLDYEIE